MSSLQKWNPMGTARWNPFKEMEEMQERMAQMFELSPFRSEDGHELISHGDWAPLVDITETDQEYCVKAELPEVKKEDVKVSVENGMLKITGERKHEEETKNRKEHRIERRYGRFMRSFALPDDVNPSKVTAESKEGILTVHIPKDVNSKTKAMDIKVS